MAGKRSRDKGKRGEREAAELLRDIFPEARRGLSQSRGGGAEEPDIVGLGRPWHIEVGVGATVSPVAKMLQAIRDAKEGSMPVVLSRRDRCQWMVTLRWSDFADLVRRMP